MRQPVPIPEVIRRAGGPVKLARAVGRHHATVLGWQAVPTEHARAVSKATGIPLHELRPDVWDPPTNDSRTRRRPKAAAAEAAE